jgi:hypothetical protein
VELQQGFYVFERASELACERKGILNLLSLAQYLLGLLQVVPEVGIGDLPLDILKFRLLVFYVKDTPRGVLYAFPGPGIVLEYRQGSSSSSLCSLSPSPGSHQRQRNSNANQYYIKPFTDIRVRSAKAVPGSVGDQQVVLEQP